MTDARHPTGWLNDRRFVRLALEPVHFRSWYFAFQWVVANETDGLIPLDDMALDPEL